MRQPGEHLTGESNHCLPAELGDIPWALDLEHAYAYLSAATDFHTSQAVDLVEGAHAAVRTAEFRSLAP